MSSATSEAVPQQRRAGPNTGWRAVRRWVALVTVFIAVATACRSSAQRSAPRELVWAIGGIDAGPNGAASDVAKAWNDQHRNGPKVRIEALPESADDQRQIMAIELNAGLKGFDILGLDVIWTGEFAEAGWLADLEDVRSRIKQESLPGAFQSAFWSGKLWAAPFTSGAGLLYYRCDLVDKPPTTWDELMKVGLEAGKRANISPFVGQGAQYEGMVVSWLEYLWGAGGDLFNEDVTEARLEEGPARRALEFMREARQSGFYAPDFSRMREEDARKAFQSGKAVLMRSWPYAYQHLKGRDSQVSGTCPREAGPDGGGQLGTGGGLRRTSPPATTGAFGIAPLPTFDGQRPISALGGYNLAVSRFSENTEAAKEFVEFASTDRDVQRTLARRHSLAPTMESAYDDLADDPVMALLGRILPDARPRPSTPEWSAISDEIQQEVFPAYTAPVDQERTRKAIRAIRGFLELAVSED